MANVEICGVAVGDARDSVEEEPEFVDESTGRTVNGTHYDERTLRKRSWRFRTSFKSPVEAEALRRHAEGDGHVANFVEDDLYTTKGVAAELLSDALVTLTGGKHSARATVTDGEYLGWTLANRMSQPDGKAWSGTSGFTLMCWRKDPAFEALGDGATFHHYVVTGAVHHTRGASADPAGFTQYRNGAAGSFGVGEWIAMLTGGVARVNGWANTEQRSQSTIVTSSFCRSRSQRTGCRSSMRSPAPMRGRSFDRSRSVAAASRTLHRLPLGSG